MNRHSTLDYWIKLLFIGAVAVLGISSVHAAPKGSPWGADYFPNTELVDQDGNKLHFYDDLIRDKVVVINFIYTQCGDTCPMQTANLRQVYKLLADRMGKDIFFYSISIDPKHDTPMTLKAYAERFRISSNAGWLFLTASETDTTLLRKKLGLFREGFDAAKLDEHNTSFLLGNEATGQWIKRSSFDEPKVLAWQLGRVMSRAKVDQNTTLASYSQATEIKKISKGEELFRSRCDSCHSLGTEEGLGPGLQGVTARRDRDWLARWLKTPDQMLAENDPVATDLFNRYQKLPMPNLRLNDGEVDALIAFIDSSER